MSKAVEGAAFLAGAVGMGVAAFLDPALIAVPAFDKVWESMAMMGITLEAGAIAGTLSHSSGMPISTRESAAPRQYVYGQQKVGGVQIFESTTGSTKRQYNQVIVLAAHECQSIQSIWLDGRMVFFTGSGNGNVTRNGVNFGGNADSNTHPGPTGNYNLGGLCYVEARFGDQVEGDVMGSLTANDPAWAAVGAESPWVAGCTYVYLKCEYDATQFPQQPGVRATINGLNTIYDPRTGNTGFTNNWALCLADFLTNPVYGLGDKVNTAQLIAAANVCDEAIELAAGGTEPQYTCNYRFDSSMAPGSVIDAILAGAAGRISYVGGEWMIYPAYWQGPSAEFNETALTAEVSWKPYRSTRDLINRVTATFIAPTYPYSSTVTAGVPNTSNLYDGNGFYNGINEGVVNSTLDWQQTDSPMYATDSLHGYPTDQYLNEDGGIERPQDLTLASVCSVGQSQRVQKVTLLRNRQQGSGTLEMNLSAFGVQSADVILLTAGLAGWTGKVLEVIGTSFVIQEGSGEGDAPSIRYKMTVQETDPSVYEWSTTEELTVYDIPANPAQTPAIPVAPTNMQLTSGVGTAIVGADGSVQAVIVVSFDTPEDPLAVAVQVQYQQVGTAPWLSAPSIDISLNSGQITPVIAGQLYNVQIRTARASGAVSPWVQILDYEVATTPSFLGTLGTEVPVIAANAASAATVPGEMLINGNFMAADLSAWQTYYNPQNTQPTLSTAEFRTGNQSLQLINQGVSQAINLTAGRTYLLSMWVMANGEVSGLGGRLGTIPAGMTVTILSQNGQNVANENGNEVESTGAPIPWTNLQMVFSVSGTGGSTSLNIANSIGAQTVTGTGWVDNVSLTDVTQTQAVINGTAASLITPITSVMTTDTSGSTVVAPVTYSGNGESVVPNGHFALGMQGYSSGTSGVPTGFTYGTDSNGPRAYNPSGNGNGLVSPSFAVIAGQKYRLQFAAYNGSGSGGIYLRISWMGASAPPPVNVIPFTGEQAGNITPGIDDFISNGSVTTTPTVYAYDWTAPTGATLASMCAYNVGGSDLAVQYFACIPYQAVSQWGADVTSNNQSATTASLANQSLDNLPDGTTYLRPTGVSTGGVYRISTPFKGQGGIVQTITAGIFTATVTSSSIAIYNASEVIPWPDGTFLTIPATGSSSSPAWSFSSLSASTGYYLSAYYAIATNTVTVVMSDVNSGKSAPSSNQQVQVINGDGHLALVIGWEITTSAAGSTGSSGGGTAPPPPTCPADDQIIETLELGYVEARMIDAGMHLRDSEGGWNLVHTAYSVEDWLHFLYIGGETYHVDLNHRWLAPGGDAMADDDAPCWIRSADLREADLVQGADGNVYRVDVITDPHMGSYRKIKCERSRMQIGSLIAHNWLTDQ